MCDFRFGVYELNKGKKAIFVYLEEGKIYVSWHTEGKDTLRLTLRQFEALQDQLENINIAFTSNSSMDRQSIGGPLHVSVILYPREGRVVDIRNFYNHDDDIIPTKIGVTLKLSIWYKIPWVEIAKYILQLQGTRLAVIKRCGKAIGFYVAKKVRYFCKQCKNNQLDDDETHECMYLEDQDCTAYQNKIKNQTEKIIKSTKDKTLTGILVDMVKPGQYPFMINFIRNNPMLMGQYAQYAIEG